MINSLRSKYMTSNYQPARTDNLCAGNRLSHMQTVGNNEISDNIMYRRGYLFIVVLLFIFCLEKENLILWSD